MIQRLKQFIESLNISVSAFEQSIGASDGMIRRAINKNTDIQSKWLSYISDNYHDLNMEWLLTGKGSMLKDSNGYIDKTVGNSVVSETNENYERKLIPFFDGIVEAGTQTVANMDGAYPTEMVDAGDFFQDATAIMAVHGDSMFPDYKPGSLIAMKEVKNKRLVMFGQDYVIETSEYRVIKRLQRDNEDITCWLACSTNEDTWEQGPMKGRLIHEPFPVPIDEVVRMYLVLGQIHRNHSSKIIYSK